MKKTITIAAYNRPDHLRMLLDSLRAQLLPLDSYTVIVSVDLGGDKFDEVMGVAQSIEFARSYVFQPSVHLGINHNTYWLMDYIFSEFGADCNVYLEDDLVLSPDAFNLVEWFVEHGDELKAQATDIGAYCLCRLWEHGDPEKIFLSRAFCAWGFAMDRHQWRRYGQPAWRSTRKTWDTSLARHIRAQGPKVFNAFPELSRATNTGREGGTRLSVERYDQMMRNHVYNQSRETYSFHIRRS